MTLPLPGRTARRPCAPRLLFLLSLQLAVGAAAWGQVPGEVSSLAWCAGDDDCLTWAPAAGALEYRVHRGAGADVPFLLDGAPDSCAVGSYDGTTTGSLGEPAPASGAFHWYLVTAVGPGGEGSAGSATGGPRILDSAGGCAAVASLVINEVDYDQSGTDDGEFVEIHNPGAAEVDLEGIVLILVNGLSSTEYGRVALDGAAPTLAAGGYLVVGSPTIVAALPPGTPAVAFGAATNSLQNGAPDGLALFDTVGGALLDALSYEGEIHAAQLDGIAGTFDLVEGVAATAIDAGAGALARLPNGTDSDVAAADWTLVDPPTPGAAN